MLHKLSVESAASVLLMLFLHILNDIGELPLHSLILIRF